MSPQPRPPLTDSPWFWVCMFATAALLGLTAAQPKYGRRQAQIEKQYQGREFSVRGRAGTESNQPYSTPDDTLRLTGYSSSQVTFDTGVSYRLTPSVQIDFAANQALNMHAEFTYQLVATPRGSVIVAAELRDAGYSVDRAFDGRSMKSQMKAADRSGARLAVIIGGDEAAAGTAGRLQ